MARIRKIEIQNLRGIKELVWLPLAGINCLIGPGDSGKSSILDAIDYCVGAARLHRPLPMGLCCARVAMETRDRPTKLPSRVYALASNCR
jgi:recombinational DNA repair ATPase RecF